MSTRVRTIAAVAAGAVAISILGVLPASAALPAPQPASASTIAHEVEKSSSITQLPQKAAKSLAHLRGDMPWRYYPAKGLLGCPTLSSCTFADKHSKRLIVLFGDSHAMMWLPAIVPWAKAAGDKVALIWKPSCPLAALPRIPLYPPNPIPLDCPVWRSKAMNEINAAKPKLIVLGERTSRIKSLPGQAAFTNAEWQRGLVATIKSLQHPGTHIALMEDLPYLVQDPASCLAIHPSSVEACGIGNHPLFPGRQSVEKASAAATGATFVATRQWFCTATCSVVIGNTIAYFDQSHVSATYAGRLSKVVGQVLGKFA